MSVFILVQGTMFRDPEARTSSKSGKKFWTATVKCKEGNEAQWIKLCVFSESAGAVLMQLRDGDALAAQGRFEAATYERDGKTSVRLTCLADSILPLRPPLKERKKKDAVAAAARSENPTVDRPSFVDTFNDAVPF
jgi:single-stranded DNA-binding protein